MNMCIVLCCLLAMKVVWHMSTCWPTTLVQAEMSQQLLDGLFTRKKKTTVQSVWTQPHVNGKMEYVL